MADTVPPELKDFEIDPDMIAVAYKNGEYSRAIEDWGPRQAAGHPEVWWDLDVNDGKGDPVWDEKIFKAVSAYNLAVRAYNDDQRKGADAKALAPRREKVVATYKAAMPLLTAYARAVMKFDDDRIEQLRRRIESLQAEVAKRDEVNKELLKKAQRLCPTEEEKSRIEKVLEALEDAHIGATTFELIKSGDEAAWKAFEHFWELNKGLIRACETAGPLIDALIRIHDIYEARDGRDRAWKVAEAASVLVPTVVGKVMQAGRLATIAEAVGETAEVLGARICFAVAIGEGVVLYMKYYVESWNAINIAAAVHRQQYLNGLLRMQIKEEDENIRWLQKDIDDLQAVVDNKSDNASTYLARHWGYVNRYFADIYYWRRAVCQAFLKRSPQPARAMAPAGR
jgi:hypothetical protein